MSKPTKDQYIKDLEYDMGTLTDMVIKLKEDKKVTLQEILDRIQNVLNQATGQYPDMMGALDLLRHDLENDIIEEKYETN